MRIPVLKPLVRKLRGPNAGSTRYLNLFPASIGWCGWLNRGDRKGMFDGALCGVGDGDGASGSSGCPAAEEETYSAVV